MRSEKLEQALGSFPIEYRIVNRDGSDAADVSSITPLGEGGSSVVVRAIHRGKLARAVKIIIPRDDLADSDSGEALFANSFQNEVDALTELTHESIARITDFGSVQAGDSSLAYFAMEHVEGEDLLGFCQREDVTGDQVLLVLQQVLSALEYLHVRGVMHCDLKEANILVTSRKTGENRTQFRAVLLDLGVSHRLREVGPHDATTYTYFFSTPDYVMRALAPYLGNRTHNRIPLAELRKFFPWQDLYSFGVILGRLVADPAVRGKLRRRLGVSGVEVLEEIQGRLLTIDPSSPRYESAGAVAVAIDRASTSSLSPLGISMLGTVGRVGVVLPDSVGRVSTSGSINAIISHPLFQRLHNLYQLDLMQYVMPGATQTRFPHALRQLDLARRAIARQLTYSDFRLDASETDIQHTLLASLLDSVGRYQLQHMFEDFVTARNEVPAAQLLRGDEVLDLMLGLPVSGIEAEHRFTQAKDDRGRTLQDVAGLDWREVRRLQREPRDPVQGFMSALMNSAVDVNKLAYLRADSQATGLPFGNVVDPEPLFEYLRLPQDADWGDAQKGQARAMLGLREDGMSYAEAAICARYWNIRTGYWNRTNRAVQTMVQFVIGRLLKDAGMTFPEYMEATLHMSTSEAVSYLSKRYDGAVAAGKLPRGSVNPLLSLRDSRRGIYQRLITISPRSEVPARADDRKIYEAARAHSPFDDSVVFNIVKEELESLSPGLHVSPGEVLLDLPRARREDSPGRIIVYADEPDADRVGELMKISPVLNGLDTAFDQYVKRMRVFIHPRLAGELQGSMNEAHARILGRFREQVRVDNL